MKIAADVPKESPCKRAPGVDGDNAVMGTGKKQTRLARGVVHAQLQRTATRWGVRVQCERLEHDRATVDDDGCSVSACGLKERKFVVAQCACFYLGRLPRNFQNYPSRRNYHKREEQKKRESNFCLERQMCRMSHSAGVGAGVIVRRWKQKYQHHAGIFVAVSVGLVPPYRVYSKGFSKIYARQLLTYAD